MGNVIDITTRNDAFPITPYFYGAVDIVRVILFIGKESVSRNKNYKEMLYKYTQK